MGEIIGSKILQTRFKMRSRSGLLELIVERFVGRNQFLRMLIDFRNVSVGSSLLRSEF